MRRKPYLYSLCVVYLWLLVTISGTWVFVMTFGGGDTMMFTLAMMSMVTVGLGMLVLASRWDRARHAADPFRTELITAIDENARAGRDTDARNPVLVTLALCVAVTIAWQDKMIGIPFATSLVIIIGVFLIVFPIMERVLQPAQRSQ